MSICRMAERLSGRWPDSQDFCGARDFDEPQPLTNQTDVNEAIAADELDNLLMDAKKERDRPKWKAAR